MKQKLGDFFKIFLAILMIPIFALVIIFWVIPRTLIDSTKNKKEEVEEDKEQLIYNKYCASCPNSKWCHEEATTCDMYAEALENERQDDY